MAMLRYVRVGVRCRAPRRVLSQSTDTVTFDTVDAQIVCPYMSLHISMLDLLVMRFAGTRALPSFLCQSSFLLPLCNF